ncbi:MAG: MBL fold metallo-hydrolase [Candidatus Uhrbacteria bacterium]|nr:MBL fold metallo-hydrolase [Candidatus Uhrbacteria bacterium]
MNISFHGAVRGVTGSCFLLETSDAKILVDCGMFQGERMCGKKNYEEFQFEPKSIDAVIVTHAHFDHIGRIPKLVREGFTGKVFMTPPTQTLSRLVLEDALNVMRENAIKCRDEVLYSEDEVAKMFELSTTINYHAEFEPAPGLKAMFHDVGHILGSAYVTIDVPGSELKGGEQKRFLFSGDVGNDNIPILPGTESISKADIAIVESTYGNRDHAPVAERGGLLVDNVKRVIERGGTLIIPAFSIERTQELLYELDELIDKNEIPKVPIYLDSPLAIRTTEAYQQYSDYLDFDRSIVLSPDKDFFSFKNLILTLDVAGSKTINDDTRPKIIIAGSGMMTGGRVLHHLKRYLEDKKSGVLIIGFQAEETLGRQIQDGAKEVSIFREKVAVNAEVSVISSFSAHGDRNKLAKWLKPKKGDIAKIFLVHGDPEVKEEFKKFLSDKIKSEIIIPKIYESFEF